MIGGNNINRFLRGCSDHRDQLFCLFELKKLISGVFEIEQSHLKITVCQRHRNLFGIRWRCNKTRCSIPTSAGIDAHKGKSSAPKAQYHGFKKRRIQPML